MGYWKQEQIRREGLQDVVIEIHRRAGNVKDARDETPCDCLNNDMKAAYSIASALYRDRDPLVSRFESRSELMDAVKDALDGLPELGMHEEGLLAG